MSQPGNSGREGAEIQDPSLGSLTQANRAVLQGEETLTPDLGCILSWEDLPEVPPLQEVLEGRSSLGIPGRKAKE